MRVSREQIERAKDETPTTNFFLWIMLAGLAFAWVSKTEVPADRYVASDVR